jgi:E3 ubiquitin-protein ligase RNF38/44
VQNDDEFDASYESLLTLQDALGEVKPRSTPEAVLRKLKRGKYREWRMEGGGKEEIRCPICLEDVRITLFFFSGFALKRDVIV